MYERCLFLCQVVVPILQMWIMRLRQVRYWALPQKTASKWKVFWLQILTLCDSNLPACVCSCVCYPPKGSACSSKCWVNAGLPEESRGECAELWGGPFLGALRMSASPASFPKGSGACLADESSVFAELFTLPSSPLPPLWAGAHCFNLASVYYEPTMYWGLGIRRSHTHAHAHALPVFEVLTV